MRSCAHITIHLPLGEAPGLCCCRRRCHLASAMLISVSGCDYTRSPVHLILGWCSVVGPTPPDFMFCVPTSEWIMRCGLCARDPTSAWWSVVP
eukprot:COSAG01_NODE_11300_length_1963_cov_29.555794_1_plen_93_part_00